MSSTHRGIAVRQVIKPNRLQKSMAKAMKASQETLAISQVSRELDLSNFINFAGFGLNTLLMAAVARTLTAHPLLNAELTEEGIVQFDTVNLGMAIALKQGLIVTVIRNAQKLTLADLDKAIQDLVQKARGGKLTLDDLEGGTFTVSNLGSMGVDSGIPIPRPPESAIILFGAAKPRPVVLADQLAIRTTCNATLSYDHRFIDGAKAAAFLTDLYNLILNPEPLVEPK